MDEKRDEYNTVVTKGKRRSGFGRFLPLLLVLLLAFLLWWFLMRGDETSKDAISTQGTGTPQNAETQNAPEQDSQALKAKFENEFSEQMRTVYFNADTAVLQDETTASTNIDDIAEFYKNNPGTKLQVNGSIFEDEQVDSSSSLAKERAELIKQQLTVKGVSQSDITVSTIDRYEGQGDSDRATYSRSAVITIAE